MSHPISNAEHERLLAQVEAQQSEIQRLRAALEKADYEFAYGLYESAKLTVKAALSAKL